MIRVLLPFDLLVILAQDGTYPNLVLPKDILGMQGKLALPGIARLALQSITPHERQHNWVCMDGLMFRGLVGSRKRSHLGTWEISHLMFKPDDVANCAMSLDRLSQAAGEAGVEKIFMRLEEDSPFLSAAIDTGFTPYMAECLYRWEAGNGLDDCSGSLPFPRRKRTEDEYRLFELYSKCVPTAVRRVEGLTFRDWQANRERSGSAEWVFEEKGQLTGWVKVGRRRCYGCLEIMAMSGAECSRFVEHGISFLQGCECGYCIVPAFQGEVLKALDQHGFSMKGRYTVLAKEPVGRKKVACLLPASA